MQNQNNRLTYQRFQSNTDLSRYLKAIGYPVGIFLLTMFAINRFNLFGVNIIAPMTGIMWLCGVIVAWFLPSHRHDTLKETHITIGVYLISLIVFKELVAKISGVSSEMLMATYNQAIPVTSGQAFSGYLQTMLWITTIMTPVGFIGMQVKTMSEMRYTPMVICVSLSVSCLWDGRNHETMTPQSHMMPVMGAMILTPNSLNLLMANMVSRKMPTGYPTAFRYRDKSALDWER